MLPLHTYTWKPLICNSYLKHCNFENIIEMLYCLLKMACRSFHVSFTGGATGKDTTGKLPVNTGDTKQRI